MTPFKFLQAGDKVRYMRTNGIGRNGVEWVEATGTVLKYLVFEDHVVVSGGPNGHVVDDSNYKGKVERIA